MKSVQYKKYRYHLSGTAAVTVRGLIFYPNAYIYSDVPLLSAADLAAHTSIIEETDLTLTSTWILVAGTRATPVNPTGLTGTVGEGSVGLNWVDDTNIDIASVEVSMSPNVGGPFTVAKGVQAKTITGLTDGTAYTFTVKTVDGAGNKSTGATITQTPTDVTPPADVTRLNAVKGAGASQQVVVTWVDPADNVGLNHIELTVKTLAGVAFSGSPFTIAAATQTKTVTGLVTNTMYQFTVKGVDAAGNKSPGITTVATPL
jgi:chitin-binding protein